MLVFIICIFLLSICTIRFIVAALNKSNQTQQDTVENTHLRLYRLRERELIHERDNGTLEQSNYEENLKNFQKQLLADTSNTSVDVIVNDEGSSPKKLRIFISLFIPLAAICIYVFIGGGSESMAWKIPTIAEISQSPSTIVKTLEKQFKPDSATSEEWHLLGRSYSLNAQFEQAQHAFSQALQMQPKNVAYIADFIEVSMLKNQGQPVEGMKSLIAAGLSQENHPKLLWLAAVVASYEDNTDDQKRYLNQLLPLIQTDDPAKKRIENILLQIEHTQDNSKTSKFDKKITQAEITVKVSIKEELKTQIKGQPVLFVFAKAPTGPPMPLAVARYFWNEAPDTIILNDSMTMIPDRKLSDFSNVTLVAQISQSGNAIASSGDLRGIVQNVPVHKAGEIQIQIEEIVK